ncbi:hypothetical protein AMECASPLE_029709 [Ameca splendens]|uniref:Uncharacterized protein n=1 Tax=Ameca splendens TaxID=208324 RepID=A0ABV0XIV5_9TELE
MCGTLPGLTTSGKKRSSSMNKDSSLSLPHWTTQVSSLLNSSLLGSPFKNPVHPPPSTAPISETPGPTYHPGTPLSTIICLTGKQPFGLSALHPLADHSINLLVSRFQFPCSLHCSVNKHFSVKLCLLNCFLHVGQLR